MTISEGDVETWNRAVEEIVARDDYEALLAQLVEAKNDPDFPDRLRQALVLMYRKGTDSGLAIMGKYLHSPYRPNHRIDGNKPMANLVDSLILTLNLDSSKFQKGAKESEQSIKKVKEAVVAHGKDVEAASSAMAAGISKIATELLGLFAIFTGGKAVKDFIADITGSDAATGRFASNLRISTERLSAWQGAVQEVGGTANDATSSFQSFSMSMQELQETGNTAVLPFLFRRH